jgi:hypothetical protein
MGTDFEKELSRARKAMGHPWVNKLRQEFLVRAAATELLDFSDEDDADAPCCPQCSESMCISFESYSAFHISDLFCPSI